MVKLSFTQLVDELIAAISVLLEAILKLENVDYCGKRPSESSVYLYEKALGNKGQSRTVEFDR